MPIELTEELSRLLQRRAAENDCVDDPLHYLLMLLLHDEPSDGIPWGWERDELEKELIKGLDSGPCKPITDQFWIDLKERILNKSAIPVPSP